MMSPEVSIISLGSRFLDRCSMSKHVAELLSKNYKAADFHLQLSWDPTGTLIWWKSRLWSNSATRPIILGCPNSPHRWALRISQSQHHLEVFVLWIGLPGGIWLSWKGWMPTNESNIRNIDIDIRYTNDILYIYMTVCRKACSQNRPNNAFPCVTPLLVIKKHTWSDNHRLCKQKH